MAHASDIYRRFIEAPLRLAARSQSSPRPLTPPSSTTDGTALPANVYGTSLAYSTHFKERKELRRHVARNQLSALDAVIPKDLNGERRASASMKWQNDCQTSILDSTMGLESTLKKDEVAQSRTKKTKRVTRSMSLANGDTGADAMDTGTRLSKPPKRVRKYSRDLCSTIEDDKAKCGSALKISKEDDVMEAVGGQVAFRRRMSAKIQLPGRQSRHVFVVASKLTPATRPSQYAKEASELCLEETASDEEDASIETIKAIAGTHQQDKISAYCDALLSTRTISGCFLALSWNALRDVYDSCLACSTSKTSTSFEDILRICVGIAECEKLAQQSFSSTSPKSKSPKLQKSRRRSSKKIMLKAKRAKKSVQFRSFDLSCLNLEYVEDERVAVMVDRILTHYGTVMEQLEAIVSRFDFKTESPEQSFLRELARVMASPSQIYKSTLQTSKASKEIFQRAFGGRDSYSQHEIRLCGEYFARQFAKLLLPRTSVPSPPQFLQRVFSSLISSSIRSKLRVLFSESEDFGENADGSSVLKNRVLLDENGQPFPAMAPYEHQDLGAAIHWALQESFLYWSLVQSLFQMLENTSALYEENKEVKAFLEESAAENLHDMEKYVLARRFLRFHLTKSWRSRFNGEGDIVQLWTSIEKICTLAKRFHFEDEAHLFPLASMDAFVTMLAREEPTLQRMEEMLHSFYCQKYGTNYLQPAPCMECHHPITREGIASSIRCTSCARQFHLECLHLPDSFAHFAGQYTCPACFLGRGGYD